MRLCCRCVYSCLETVGFELLAMSFLVVNSFNIKGKKLQEADLASNPLQSQMSLRPTEATSNISLNMEVVRTHSNACIVE
jgi:hypothetical protein